MTTTFLPDRTVAPGLLAAGGTCVGNRYRANFDVLHVGDAPPVLAVADGMGDGEGSATAGRTAMATFTAQAGRSAEDLLAAVARVQRDVRDAGRRLGGQLTGCTLTALVPAAAGRAWIVQLGDSRVYRRRGNVLELLTVDHTMAWLGAVNGWYAHDSPQAHAARYHLLRYAGHPDEPEPDVVAVTLRPGDAYLLCTDGVAEQVPFGRIDEHLASGASPAAVARGLVADSLAAGGQDNATCVVLRVS